MRSLLYIIAVILVIGWLFGFFFYSATGLIHVLLVLAVIALILGIIQRAWSGLLNFCGLKKLLECLPLLKMNFFKVYYEKSNGIQSAW